MNHCLIFTKRSGNWTRPMLNQAVYVKLNNKNNILFNLVDQNGKRRAAAIQSGHRYWGGNIKYLNLFVTNLDYRFEDWAKMHPIRRLWKNESANWKAVLDTVRTKNSFEDVKIEGNDELWCAKNWHTEQNKH